MICHHKPGDRDCTSGKADLEPYSDPYRPKYKDPIDRSNWNYETPVAKPVETPDSKNYTIEEINVIGPHIVMKVKYPNCKKCSYEGLKVLVFLNLPLLSVVKWKTIDPHFNDNTGGARDQTMAPSPSARFPGSDEGWEHACSWVKSMIPPTKPESTKGVGLVDISTLSLPVINAATHDVRVKRAKIDYDRLIVNAPEKCKCGALKSKFTNLDRNDYVTPYLTCVGCGSTVTGISTFNRLNPPDLLAHIEKSCYPLTERFG